MGGSSQRLGGWGAATNGTPCAIGLETPGGGLTSHRGNPSYLVTTSKPSARNGRSAASSAAPRSAHAT
eukprot:6762800-Prymnesium_polylepis.1